MAADLGTWSPEQAQVLLDVLQRAGLSPQARRVRGGVQVSVDDEESDLAHATLVANMDAIAQAAQPAAPARRSRTPRRDRDAAAGRGSDPPDKALASERLLRWAPVIGLLVIGSMISLAVPPLRLPVVLATVLGIVYLLGKRTDRQDR